MTKSTERKQVVKKVNRLVIKIGSGVLTNKQGLNLLFFKSLAKDIIFLRQQGIEVILVSSGAIACGMDMLKLKERPSRIPQKQAVAALGQPKLMHVYSEYFSKKNIPVAQILLTREDIQDRHRFLMAKHALMELLKIKALPIINENDSVAVEEIRVGDNDQLSAWVAHLVEADLLIMMTDVDGFFDKDPSLFPDAQRVPLVSHVDERTFQLAGGTKSAKSIGGMITKLEAAKQAARFGVPTWLINGKCFGILKQVFKGEDVGTLFFAV